jgi:hypothetical protein
MKVKLLNVLTVCVVTLTVLSPGILVFSMVWGRHIEFAKAQNLTCEVNNNRANDLLLLQSEGVPFTCNQPNLKTKQLSVTEQYKLVIFLEWFFLLTPICVGLGIIIYDRYLVYRNAVFQEQVEMLERLWQQNIEQ